MQSKANITVNIPRELRGFCNGAAQVAVPAANVQAVLDELERRYPPLHRGVCDETGRLRRHINLFVNTTHMCECNGLDTTLQSGDTITLLPAVSGG